MMDVKIRAKLDNHRSVTLSAIKNDLEAVRAEVAVIADQDYEKI